ncbi:MAG: thioredoxin domain-containing protein [Alphaproteobacteria bacterium]|nr:thioredoxin domain-containing protein [Alphaproteobacteria bacterium]
MLKFSFKSIKMAATGLLMAAVLAFSAAPRAIAAEAASSAPVLTKEQVETIVHDYIMNHADVVLDAVEKYQTTSMQKRQDDAMKMNHDELFNNEKSPFIGNPKGDVTVIEFFDYNCHFCKGIFPKVQKIVKDDKDVKIIFKDFPILGPTSEVAAKWALAAQKQDKYFAFHTALMSHNGPLDDDFIEKTAKDVGMDIDKAKKDIDGTDIMIQIERNRTLANQMNFNGTPSFIVNDQAFSGTPDGGLEQAIDNARDKLKEKADGKKDDKK